MILPADSLDERSEIRIAGSGISDLEGRFNRIDLDPLPVRPQTITPPSIPTHHRRNREVPPGHEPTQIVHALDAHQHPPGGDGLRPAGLHAVQQPREDPPGLRARHRLARLRRRPGVVHDGPDADVRPLVDARPGPGPPLPAARRLPPGVHRQRLQPGDPRRRRRRPDQGRVPQPRAGEVDPGHRLDVHRPHPRAPGPVPSGGRGGRVRLAACRPRGPHPDPGRVVGLGPGVRRPGVDLRPGGLSALPRRCRRHRQGGDDPRRAPGDVDRLQPPAGRGGGGARHGDDQPRHLRPGLLRRQHDPLPRQTPRPGRPLPHGPPGLLHHGRPAAVRGLGPDRAGQQGAVQARRPPQRRPRHARLPRPDVRQRPDQRPGVPGQYPHRAASCPPPPSISWTTRP